MDDQTVLTEHFETTFYNSTFFLNGWDRKLFMQANS